MPAVTNFEVLVPRLRQFILLLSSDQPGEVFAATRAIGKTLQAAGMDWHDLADHLLAPAKQKSSAPPPPPPPQPEEGWKGMTDHQCEQALDDMQKAFGLTVWEFEFVASIQEQFIDGHRLSEKQVAVLDRILRKMGKI